MFILFKHYSNILLHNFVEHRLFPSEQMLRALLRHRRPQNLALMLPKSSSTDVTHSGEQEEHEEKPEVNAKFTYKRSDFVQFDPAFILQEPEDEIKSFRDFVKTYGEHRFARPAPNYPERDFVASDDPEEWKNVERLIPPELVPDIPDAQEYPSGFQPPMARPGDYPYYVQRTTNHMMPVYLIYDRSKQDTRTVIRRADGNLFQLRDDLRKFLFSRYNKDFISQVAEVYGRVAFRGDFETDFKEFLLNKGF